MWAKSDAVLHIGLFRRDANGVFVPVAIGHARSRSWGRWSSDAATSFRRKRSWAPAGPGLWWRRGICSFRPRRFARSSAPRNRGRVAPRQKSGGLSICRAGDPGRGRSSKRSARSRQFWQTWCRILQPFRHIRCTGPKCDRRRAGARRLSITKEWCYGATVDEIASAMGWQRHTVRGLFSGTLKKKLGLTLASAQEERGRVYRIAAPEQA